MEREQGAFRVFEMNRARTTAVCLALVIVNAYPLASQEFEIGIIDFYGLGRVSEDDARRALAFRVGDTITLSGDKSRAVLAESERRLSTLPGVTRGHANVVCCDAGRVIVYVGVEGREQRATRFRPPPRGNARLPADMVQSGNELSAAVMSAVQRGDAGEDDTQGHALFHDPAARAIQERFVGYAARDLKRLRNVLRTSADADHRALAAEILGYVADKQGVVSDLVYGMSDSSSNVRNIASRSLVVFARMASTSARPMVRVPYKPFIELLQSPVWTDRNKASMALMELSERGDSKLLGTLRRQAIVPLIEAARWKSEGHATPALMILGRIAGQSDVAIQAAVSRGEREEIINEALKRQ
jgi:hypothetical protein